jgi:pimeloyl-ACP methyl ester carboxylesterase
VPELSARQLAAGGLGLFGVGAAVGGALGVALENMLVGRTRLRRDPEAREPLGRLPASGRTLRADDGVLLQVEEAGEPDAPLTVVFCHGYTLEMACWHYQRRDLADMRNPRLRLVFYDQRSHGRSGRSDPERATIDQLGADLRRVLDVVVPHGPVVLVGHSMGGMTILSLASQAPELFGPRVVGVGLVATSAGQLAEVTLGLPATLASAFLRVAPRTVEEVQRQAELVERGRVLASDVGFLLARRLNFGSRRVSPSLVAFTERMISATPAEVIADFFPTFVSHDKLAAVPVLERVATLVVAGESDLLTPVEHSRAIAEALPDAELVVLPGAGHMVMLERHQEVSDALERLVRRAAQAAGVPLGSVEADAEPDPWSILQPASRR